MNPGYKIATSLILLVGIVFIAVHPFVDLGPTVLRILQTSAFLFAAFVFVRALAARRPELHCYRIVTDSVPAPRRNASQVINLNCSRLC